MAQRRMPIEFITRPEARVAAMAPQNWAAKRRPDWASLRCQAGAMIGRMGPRRVLTMPVRMKPR